MLVSLLEPEKYKTPKDVEIAYGLQPEILSIIFRNRRLKRELKDVTNLPPLKQTNLSDSLELGDEQQALYKAILDNDELQASTKIHELRKALLNPSLVNPDVVFDKNLREHLKKIESAKYKALDKIIEDKVRKGEKTVIFSPVYKTRVTRNLAKRYKQYGAVLIDGDVPYEERESIRKRFQSDSEIKVLVATTATTGEAVSLNSASNVVLLDEPFTPAVREQAIGRVYRRGQKNPVEVISLSIKNTIDQGILELLELKNKAIEFMEEGGRLPPELADSLNDEAKSRPIVKQLYTPQQIVRKLSTMMKDKGARRILAAVHRKPGIAKQYTDNYTQDWETSYQANTARVYIHVIDALSEKVDLGMKIDLGSGPGVLSHMLDEETVNIELLKEHYKDKLANRENGNLLATMATLPVRGSSMGLAVASLSFDYTSNEKTEDLIHTERENAVREANRVLKDGGYFVVTLPHGVVDKNASQKLERGLTGLGFEVVPELTGIVRSGDNNADFQVYLMTARKTRQPSAQPRHSELQLSTYKKPSYTMRKKGVVENFDFVDLENGAKDSLDSRLERYLARI
ncbi:methyltransferase domain-containing protein [archaeon]|nr:MAG: methyltransferase domain-containing protein [archaeon]